MTQLRVWKCGNCGHEVPIPDDGSIGELRHTQYDQFTSRTACPACGSYTLQQAYDNTFTRGIFLVVKSHIKFRGK